jgi:RNA methyltransferase, TrmH family
MKPKEIPVCGLAAVQALFEKEPGAIKRLFFDSPTSRRVARITSALAKTRRVYRVVTPAELEKIGGTKHHGGIVAVIEARVLVRVSGSQIREWAARRAPLLILDRVGNAHNLGAIARTAAFFGVEDLILPDHPQQAVPGEAAYRVAEGGLEHLHLWQVGNLAEFCRALRDSYDVLGTSVSAGAQPISKWKCARGRGAPRPLALVMGNEEHGLSSEVAKACTALVHLPAPQSRVESLNVSVAAGILIWELWARGD